MTSRVQLVGAIEESMKQAFALRAAYLADPAFAPVPTDRLLEDALVDQLVEAIDAHHRTDSSERRSARARSQILSLAQTMLRQHPDLDRLAESVATDFGEGDEAKTEVVKQLFAQIDADHDTKISRAEFTAAIKELSARAAHFVTPHAMHEHPDFSFDWIEHRPFAEAAYTGDTRLSKLLPRLVPKRCADAARAAAYRLPARRRAPPTSSFSRVRAGCRRSTSGATTSRTSSPSSGASRSALGAY